MNSPLGEEILIHVLCARRVEEVMQKVQPLAD